MRAIPRAGVRVRVRVGGGGAQSMGEVRDTYLGASPQLGNALG